MPLSFNESIATGVTTAGSALGTDFPIYFPYLAKAHINSDFNKVLQSQANFVVYDANEAVAPAGAFGTSTAFIRYTTGFPTAGATVRVRRTTEKAFPLVDFQDGSALTADDQDLAFLQNFYLNQESVEQADNALGKVGLVYYGNGVRITEIGQPTENNDATTKLYVDTRDALKVTKAGDTMSGALAMGSNKITGLGTPTANADAATKLYVDTADATLTSSKVNKAGDTMSGNLDLNSNKITNLGTPTANGDAVTKLYVDTYGTAINNAKVSKSGDTMSGALAMGNSKITGLATPTANDDATTKAYADTKLSLSGGTLTGTVDFGGFPITAVGNPVSLSDATTKQYVDSSIQQYITTGGVAGNPTRWQFTGDGTTLAFSIAGATAIYTNSYLVVLDGVVQDPTYSFNVNIGVSTQTLTFVQAPSSGVRIVVIALGYALPTISAIPNNTVGSGAIVDGSVGTSELADDAVTSAKLRDDVSVDANRAVTTNHIRDLAVTTAKLADDSVTSAKLADDASVDANRAVTTNHIKDLNVTTAKIAANAVTDAKLSSDASVDANRAVNTNHIKDLAVSTAKVAANAITDAKLSSSPTVDASRAVTTNHIKDLAVTDAKLSVIAGLTAGTYGSATAIPVFGVNTAGRVTSASTQNITIPSQKLVNIWSTTFTSGLTLSGYSWVNVLSQAVTLQSASNRVLISGMVSGSGYQYQMGVRLVVVNAGAPSGVEFGSGNLTGNRVRMHSYLNNYEANAAAVQGYQQYGMPLNFLHTPGYITNTYYVQATAYSGANASVNRSWNWQEGGASGYDGCPVSTLTLMEVTP